METEGWLDERSWEILTKDQLQAMGSCDGHIELFMGGINKNKRAKTIASDKLKRWSIPQSLINTMHEDGYLDEANGNICETKHFTQRTWRDESRKRHDDRRKRIKENMMRSMETKDINGISG
eukprot:408550_1